MRIADLPARTAIFGLGREGEAMLRAIRCRRPDLAVTILNDSPLTLPDDDLTHVISGACARQVLGDFEVIIKSPGVSPYAPEFIQAQAQGVTLTSPTRLWFSEYPQARTLCVTGTKGKSTSASLLAHLLRYSGARVALGGNIGLPLWEIAPNSADWWVIELSSYQTSDLDAQPDLSILLNLYPEHTDWHGAYYFRDKLNLLHCTGAHPKIVNRNDANTLKYLPDLPNYHWFNDRQGFHVRAGEVWRAEQKIPLCLKLPGAHNLSNLCAVFTALDVLGFDPASCAPGLMDFIALPHRLHFLGEYQGVGAVDDSISTTPQSVIAALAAFPHDAITLLVGGYERHLDWGVLAEYLHQHPIHCVICMGANGARIAQALQDCPVTLACAATLTEAVPLARRLTPQHGLILLSPGSPSYGEFKNFQERGQVFAALLAAT
jgi:UDP-N-acetylmuramoyl-L-alanine---L-glutamate ligase